MPVKTSDISYRETMEEICRKSKFDPDNMTEIEHLDELCLVADYLHKTLEHYSRRFKELKYDLKVNKASQTSERKTPNNPSDTL